MEAEMVNEETIEKLIAMRMRGLAKAFREEMQSGTNDLTFEERFGFLVDREWTLRQEKKQQRRLKEAKLPQPACMEDLDLQTPRGLDRAFMRSLASCQWIRDNRNILLTGPTGVGKSYIACALANKACREGLSVLYIRVPRLFQELALSHADGSYFKFLGKLGKTNLLIIDDWGFSKLKESERMDLLEVIEMRSIQGSTLIASQLPVEKWHEHFDDPTIADAVLDRIIHNAYKLQLKGESMRKRRSDLT